MPYVRQQFLDRTFTAFSVPPGAAPGLDQSLSDLNQIQFLIQQPGGIARLAEAVRAASDEQISLAQPQLTYALKELTEGMLSYSVAMSIEERGLKAFDVRDGRDAVSKAVRVIAQDARQAMKACDRTPGSKTNLQLLRGVLEMLAEAKVFTGALTKQSGSPRDIENARAADLAFAEIAVQLDSFRAEVGPRYAEKVLAVLDDSATILARAAEQAASDIGPVAELTDRRIGMAGILMPGQERLWKQSLSAPNEIAPLGEGLAAKVRDAVASVLSDYHETFGVGGFVRVIKSAAVSAHWQAERYMSYANDPSDDEDKARREVAKDRGRLHRDNRTVEDYLKDYRSTRQRYKVDGQSASALAADLRGILALAARQLRPDLPQERRMRFAVDEASGAVVGRFEDEQPGDRALVIYDDAGAGHYEAAVLMVSMRAGILMDGVPPIDDVRDGKDRGMKGSNYRSFHEAISGLGNDFDQCYFVGGRFVIANPGEVPELKASEAAPEPSGPRR